MCPVTGLSEWRTQLSCREGGDKGGTWFPRQNPEPPRVSGGQGAGVREMAGSERPPYPVGKRVHVHTAHPPSHPHPSLMHTHTRRNSHRPVNSGSGLLDVAFLGSAGKAW